MTTGWIRDVLAAAAIIFLISIQGCTSMSAPNLLTVANDPATGEQKSITDKAIFQFSDQLRSWWGSRSMHVEAFGTGTLIAMDAVTSAALATSGAGVGTVRGLVAAVDFLKALYQRVDPKSRDGAFNSGSQIVLAAQAEYLKCITQKRAAVPSDKTVTPCGAAFLVKINSAVSVVGDLMVGVLPGRNDFDKVTQPVSAQAID